MRNYLIIGASTGIGAATTAELIDKAQVYGTFNKHEIQNNVGSYRHFDVMESDLETDWLPDVIDGLVYCPGSINLKPFHRFSDADFINDFELQVLGAIKVIRAVLPKLKKAEQASIVLFSTVAVANGFPFHSQVSISKGAIEGLTRALAAEYAPKIRVNCIAPSLVDTPLAGQLLNNEKKIEVNAQKHPLKRVGRPDDVAKAVEYLLSEKSSWVTGQILKIDGGISSLKV